jgi:PAS domain-containing protein
VRWDRLFEELEAQASDIERDERDALVDELRDGEWSQTSWRDLVGGSVALEVLGAGRIEGRATLVNERLVRITGERVDHVVAASAVLAVHSAERRADEPGRVGAALGWGHVFRALRDAGEPVVIRLVDGSSREGVPDVVGRDFVRLTAPSGRRQDLVWTAIAMVSGRT